MNRSADLHIHTHFSDGTFTPEQVVEKSLKAGLSCISITDHDTVDGVIPTQKAAEASGLEVITGIELSSESGGKDIHVLGYFVDCHNEAFVKALHFMQEARVVRIERMIGKLKEFGITNISLDEVCALTQSKSVGRPHLAMTLVKKGWVGSLREAFDRYLGENAPAYVEKYIQTPHEVIALIRKAGGVAVLAHPMLNNRDEMIPSLVQEGLQGLETYYPNISSNIVSYYEGIAHKHNLIRTGGSDAHGDTKDNTFIGKVKIPYETVEQMRKLAGNAL